MERSVFIASLCRILFTPRGRNSVFTDAERLTFHRNPSSGSLVTSETGSLDRMKAVAERRKKGLDDSGPTVSGRVEGTRVNPDSLIDELLKNTKLDQLEESAESKSNRLAFNGRRRLIAVFALHFQQPDCNCSSPETARRRWAATK